MENINDILKVFLDKYPDTHPTHMYRLDDGYLIVAPKFLDEVDYANPQYYVSKDLKTIRTFYMSDIDKMFDAFSKPPIWTREKNE